MNEPTRLARRLLLWGIGTLLLLLMAVGFLIVRAMPGIGRAEPVVSHEMVVERLREVAKLVATEMTLRDVVIYEQTRFRSTKRVLLVVTGRVGAWGSTKRTEGIRSMGTIGAKSWPSAPRPCSQITDAATGWLADGPSSRQSSRGAGTPGG